MSKATCEDRQKQTRMSLRSSGLRLLSPYAVAAARHVPRTRIERIAHEEKPETADTALRLGKFFKTGAAFWTNIQARYDLETAEDALALQIRKIAAYEAA
jgi:antitoxin HigA-1